MTVQRCGLGGGSSEKESLGIQGIASREVGFELGLISSTLILGEEKKKTPKLEEIAQY